MTAAETVRSARGQDTRKKQALYMSVCQGLRQRLNRLDAKEHHPLPPLRELARQFKVSTVTVRQALRVLEKEGEVQCVPGVGVFVPVPVPARQLTGPTTIALVAADIGSTLATRIANHLEAACQQRGWGLQLFISQDDPQSDARNLSGIARSSLAAVIVLPHERSENLEALVRLKLSGLPIVLVDHAMPWLKVDVVESDHHKAAYLATDYLLGKGHHRVLLLAAQPGSTSLTDRISGYEQALLDHGLEPRHRWKIWVNAEAESQGKRDGNRWWGGRCAMIPVLKTFDPPFAVLVDTAYRGWGVIEACRELGSRVPEDVSVVCLEDAEFGCALSPPMSAIQTCVSDLGRITVELLEKHLTGHAPAEAQHIVIDVQLLERASVASAPQEQAKPSMEAKPDDRSTVVARTRHRVHQRDGRAASTTQLTSLLWGCCAKRISHRRSCSMNYRFRSHRTR